MSSSSFTQVISRNQADDSVINIILGLIFADYLCGNEYGFAEEEVKEIGGGEDQVKKSFCK